MKKFYNLRLIGFVTILSLALFFMSISFVEAQKEAKGKPPGKGKPTPPPPLVVQDINLATWDFSD
ncbi:unnamed protein product, partial [marine sediment metagenome]